ncbi:MAG: penicillin acylase family protein, partial [Lewinella sp.]|nr:penicillin acylase family protein [Lewinella sp.]
LGRVPGLGSGYLDANGFRLAPNALQAGFGPSWRMVVSLETPVQAWGVYPGGASGNPGSPLYTRGLEYWRTGRYFTLLLVDSPDDDRLRPREFWTFE